MSTVTNEIEDPIRQIASIEARDGVAPPVAVFKLPARRRRPLLFAALASMACTMAFASTGSRAQTATAEQIARGKYLVEFGGCNDCHTPGYLLGKPDLSRYLSGSDVGFEVPGQGIFVAPNLTPDRETGLGDWTKGQIVDALQFGVRPDGRVLTAIMPWRAFAKLTKGDAEAIADYLKSLPPIGNKVPGPFGPGEKVPIYVMGVRPPADGSTLGR